MRIATDFQNSSRDSGGGSPYNGSGALFSPALVRLPGKSIHKSGRHVAGDEVGFGENLMMYRHACLDALDDGCIKSSVHSPDRQVPSTMVNDYLGYQRIIEWRHEQAGERCRIDTNSRPSREVDPGY